MDDLGTETLRYGVPGFVLFGLGFVVKLVVQYMHDFTQYYADELEKERKRAEEAEKRARSAEEYAALLKQQLIIHRIPPPNRAVDQKDILAQQDKEL